jgi:hypothetical protein
MGPKTAFGESNLNIDRENLKIGPDSLPGRAKPQDFPLILWPGVANSPALGPSFGISQLSELTSLNMNSSIKSIRYRAYPLPKALSMLTFFHGRPSVQEKLQSLGLDLEPLKPMSRLAASGPAFGLKIVNLRAGPATPCSLGVANIFGDGARGGRLEELFK